MGLREDSFYGVQSTEIESSAQNLAKGLPIEFSHHIDDLRCVANNHFVELNFRGKVFILLFDSFQLCCQTLHFKSPVYALITSFFLY